MINAVWETYEDFLQSVYGLIHHWNAVDFSNFIADVQGCLTMDHPAVHYPCHDAFAIFVHLQGDSLRRKNKIQAKFTLWLKKKKKKEVKLINL